MRLIIAVVMFGYLGCHEKQNSNQISHINLGKDSIYSQCIKCDSIIASFPRDASSFEKLFGYPNGEKYDGYEAIQNYFTCLELCYNYDNLIAILLLGNEIKFDADAPTHLQSFISDFLINHETIAKNMYENLTCSDFSRHIQFLFNSIDEHDHYYELLCTFLRKLNLKDSCKVKYIQKYYK